MTDDVRPDDLPLDIDHLAPGELQHRIRSLDADQLETLLEYEEHHGARAPVTTLLRSRIDQLREGASPTPGGAEDPVRPAAAPAEGAVGPETQGPPVNPPAHGVPTNPAQPRT